MCVKACAKINYEFLGLKELANELTPFATEVRYPESFYPDLYEPIGEEAITCAEHILTFTKAAIDVVALKKKSKRRQRASG